MIQALAWAFNVGACEAARRDACKRDGLRLLRRRSPGLDPGRMWESVVAHSINGRAPRSTFAALTFPYNKVLCRHGETQVFVAAGAGTFLQKSRIGTGNEIDLISLVAQI